MSKNPNGAKKWRLICLILPALLFFNSALFSQYVVNGKIIDESGKILAGATIAEKGTNKSTISKEDGNFTLNVSGTNARLVVSYVGYMSTEIAVNNRLYITVILTSLVSSLEQVVVIGYGTAKKKDLTGAISSVSEKDFNKGVFSSPDQLIQGKVSGVQIINNSGSPGGGFTVKIRGNSALTGTGQPLYVVDGVPLDGRSVQDGNNALNFLNTNDIESIDVLKDASATAIYGSRAAYGVIIITTKKGHAGLPKLDIATSTGFVSILRKVHVLNATEYREALNYYNVGSFYDHGGNSDALQSILQHGLQQNYNIAGSGGNQNGNYRFSLGYLNQDGLLINTNFKKYNADITSSAKFLDSKRLSLDFHLNASQYFQSGSFINFGDGPIVRAALQWNPTDSIKKADGTVNNDAANANPLGISQTLRETLKVTTILGSISPSYKITDWLEYKLLLSVNYNNGIDRLSSNQALGNLYFLFNSPFGTATIKNYELTTTQATQTLSFNKEIFKGLHLNAVAGYEFMKFTSKGFSLSGNGPNGGFGNYGLDYTNYIQYSYDSTRSISSYIDPLYELQSYFGRAIFNYQEKYFLTATFRADGSTKFGANNKYGYFPSFAFAWNIFKEKFFNIDWVNSFKMRAGWGKTGNQEFPPGSAQALYAFQNAGTYIQINNPNPNLKWQSDRQFNVGIDFSLLANRISGTIDYFNKETTNLLYPSPAIQPAPPGAAITWINLPGHIINKGFEFLIKGTVIKDKNFKWDVSTNMTFLKNSVSGISAPLFTGPNFVQTIRNGLPLDAFYTRKFLGLDKANGFSIYQDNDNAFFYVGNPNPTFLLGISSTFSYKKVSLIVNMNGSFGQDIYDANGGFFLFVGSIKGGNITESIYHNPIKESFANPVTPSSRYIHSGDYLRMANLTLNYDIGNVIKSFKGFNVYITAQNLFIITKYEGFDPEVNAVFTNNGVNSLGIDIIRYPSSRTFLAGIRFSL